MLLRSDISGAIRSCMRLSARATDSLRGRAFPDLRIEAIAFGSVTVGDVEGLQELT
jgi:hypothetical protein